jgi:hypothetical protein
MRYITFLLIFLFFNSFTFSQELDYSEYHKACFDAEFKAVTNKQNEAWRLYNLTFKKYFPLISNINKAIELGELLSIKDKNIKIELSRLIDFKNVFFAENSIIKDIKNLKQKKQLKLFFPYLNESDFATLTSQKLENAVKLSNFLFLDQSVRKIKDNNCKDSLMVAIDKKIHLELMPYIKKNGYPTQREYGMFAIYPCFLFMHSTMRYGITEEIKSIILEQIKKGNFNPSGYAVIIDRFRTWSTKEAQLYGEWNENGKIGPIYDIKNIDVRRQEIGIEPFYEFCIKHNYTLPEDYIIPEKYKK